MAYKNPILFLSTANLGVCKVLLKRDLDDGVKSVNVELPKSSKILEAADKLLPHLDLKQSHGGRMSAYIYQDRVEIHDNSVKDMHYCTLSFKLHKTQQEAFKEIVKEVIRLYGFDGIVFDIEERPVG